MTAYPRIMLAAGSSGSGKTMTVCALLQILKNRGMQAAAFKCGPDYIDPMFHEKVIHTKSRNLDTFFTDERTTRYLFRRNAKGADISVMEGVMGYYDGLGGISDRASAYDLARVTRTPVVLIVNTKGMSLSVLAYLKGFLTYRTPSQISGVILNQMSPMLYGEMKELVERELGIRAYGYIPKLKDCALESRHLGLVLPGEVEKLGEKLQKIAEVLEETLDIEGLLEIAANAPELEETPADGDLPGMESHNEDMDVPGGKMALRQATGRLDGEKLKIAVSRDEAFCFIYEDNIQLLRELGAEILEFSPIHDRGVPEKADGVLLYGGYPELYAKELSENEEMLRDVREKLTGGMPCMAECGGFMYLHKTMEDMQGKSYPMAGVIDGRVYRTEKLGRFGYIELERTEEAGLRLRGHEFHYFDSTSCGESYVAKKPLRKRTWKCLHETETMLAGFPHLYYYSNPDLARRFLEKCEKYHNRK